MSIKTDLSFHPGWIQVLGQRIMTVGLCAETSQSMFTIRVWPNGMMQKLYNWNILTLAAHERQVWKGKAVLDLEAAYDFCRASMLDHALHPEDRERYYKMQDRLRSFKRGDVDPLTSVSVKPVS